MPEEPPPWWYESESEIALQMREGFAHVGKRLDLVFGVSTEQTDSRIGNTRL